MATPLRIWKSSITKQSFEGEALGDYRLFVDLAEGKPGEGKPRVPSTISPLTWRLDRGQVAELVLLLVFASVLLLIIDLDRAGEGLLKVSQQAMIDLQQQIRAGGS
mgnify:CR=1 FL=1